MRKSAARSPRTGHVLSALGLALALGAGAPDAAAQVLPTNPSPNPAACSVSAAEFNTWFKSGSAAADGFVNPADSIGLNTSTNCNFYKWAEQMFLWLTSPASGGGSPYPATDRVYDSEAFYQLVNDSFSPQFPLQPVALAAHAPQSGPNGLPTIVDSKGHIREFVTAPANAEGALLAGIHKGANIRAAKVRPGPDGKVQLLDKSGKVLKASPSVTADMLPKNVGRLARFSPAVKDSAAVHKSARARMAEQLTRSGALIKFGSGKDAVFAESGTGLIVEVDMAQAGSSGVLISQTGSMVYYEKLVNDVFAWYLTGRKTPGGIAPLYNSADPTTYGQFPTTAADLQQVITFAQAHRPVLPPVPTFADGQALAVELKLSWVDAATLPSTDGYILTNAQLPVYDTANPSNWVPTGNTRLGRVALVGMHVVGSAQNHPEMIWATFEHQANSPLATYTYTSADNQTVTVQQNTSGKWLFSADGAAAPYNNKRATYDSASGAIQATTGNTIGPSNVLHQKAWGVASNGAPNQHDATAAAANTDVIMLNTSVRKLLPAADVRSNYLFMGATWTNNGGEPTTPYPAGGNIIGSSMLSNSTLETYTQGGDSTYQTGINCFTCHSSSGNPPNPNVKADTYVSHIFESSKPLTLISGTEKTKTKAKK